MTFVDCQAPDSPQRSIRGRLTQSTARTSLRSRGHELLVQLCGIAAAMAGRRRVPEKDATSDSRRGKDTRERFDGRNGRLAHVGIDGDPNQAIADTKILGHSLANVPFAQFATIAEWEAFAGPAPSADLDDRRRSNRFDCVSRRNVTFLSRLGPRQGTGCGPRVTMTTETQV